MIIKQPKITLYPARFPAPTSISYGGSTDYGLTRTVLNGGGVQQRYFGSNPTSVTMQYRMTLKMYHDWSAFINTYGDTRWVLAHIVGLYGGVYPVGDTDPLYYDIIRFGDHSMVPLGADYVQVHVNVELLPRDVGDGLPGMGGDTHPPLDISDWIVAGDPANPSPDWIVGGSPGAPSVNIIAGGTPATHGS